MHTAMVVMPGGPCRFPAHRPLRTSGPHHRNKESVLHRNQSRSHYRFLPWLAGFAATMVLLLAGLLAACGYQPSAADSSAYVAVCADQPGFRVPDQSCGGADPDTGAALDTAGYVWDYYPPSYHGSIAAYHQRVVGVSIIHTVPVTTATQVIVIDRGASAAGGSASSIRRSAAASHNQVTERPRASATTGTVRPTPAATRSSSPTPTSATATRTRNPSITRGGFGPRAAR